MTCTRCQGCLTPERFNDVLDDTGQMGFIGWRCINCGNVFDRVILEHRTQGAAAPYRSQRRWSGTSRPVWPVQMRAERPVGKAPDNIAVA